jgi:hypothetical protein
MAESGSGIPFSGSARCAKLDPVDIITAQGLQMMILSLLCGDEVS